MEVFGKPLGIIIPPNESKSKLELFVNPLIIKTMPKGCGKPKPKK